jgi:predicted permease
MLAAIREASRSLLRTPVFFATAVLSIGISVGLAGSVFAVVYAAFFTRLPFPEPERLLELWETPGPGSAQVADYLQPVRMLDLVEEETRHLASIAGTGMGPMLTMGGPDDPIRVEAASVVGDWFATMGVPAARGRALAADDARPGAERALVVSDRFASAVDVDLGATIELSGATYTVVGVMPRAFDATRRVWMAAESLPEGITPLAYAGVARVRAGSTLQEATLEIQQMAAAQVAADSARYGGFGATARSYGALARGASRPRLWMLAGVVAAVILIGLSNLTQLFLVRAQGRSRALAVRAALGGSAWQIGRGLAAEGALVGVLGGLLGLLLTVVGKDAVRAFLGGEYLFPSEPVVGPVVVVFALGVTVLASVTVGLEPLRRLRSLDLQGLLQRRAAGATSTRAERRTQRVMVAVQVATCVVLVAAGTVLASAYRALYRLDVGYDAAAVVQAVPEYGMARMDGPAQWDLARTVAERLRRHPAVAGVAVWEKVGEDYPPRSDIDAVFDGTPREIGRLDRLGWYYAVEPGFFEAMGIEVLAGRSPSASDGPGEALVAVVTRGGAAAWWPGEDPIGHQLKLGREGPWMTVVGVVEDVHPLDELGLTFAMNGRHLPFAFVSSAQMPTPPYGWRPFGCCAGVMIGVRPATSTALAAAALRSELTQAAAHVAADIGVMSDLQVGYAGSSIALTGRMVAAGTLVALALALFGVIGVVREGLARRTREIGLRIALGARGHEVVRLTAREVALTILGGALVGLGLVIVVDRTLSSVLFGAYVPRLTSGVLDPPVLSAAVALVVAVGVATAAVTASGAAKVDPAVALRSD